MSSLNSTESKHDCRPNGRGTTHKFKGVVSQQNGHWGAQIYASHRRVWLGTFKSENEAAMAYDSAAIRLRARDTHRNLPWNNTTIQEPKFQSQCTTEELLNMIKDGSYAMKFADFLKTNGGSDGPQLGLTLKRVNGNEEGLLCKHLFQKSLTPSDVGNLNRLVIPKNCAVEYFPDILKVSEDEKRSVNDTYLVFHDRLMKRWEFRYCYWRSSHSFVFTKGWNRFVKEMGLKATDVIAFYLCKFEQEERAGQVFSMIDVHYNRGGRTDEEDAEAQVGTQMGLPQVKDSLGLELALSSEKKGFTLFGVQIC